MREPRASIDRSIRLRPFNPLRAVGYLFRKAPEGGALGSCFAFHKAPYFLTAAHCVRGVPSSELSILLPGQNEHYVGVEAVAQHGEADLAVLRVDTRWLPESAAPFWRSTQIPALGDDFATYGFPSDPEPQFAKGYFRRFREHQSHMGFRYLAGEVSAPIEQGMSGAPVFMVSQYDRVVAVATESFTSSLVVDSVEEALSDGRVRETVAKRVVALGVVVLLWPLESWLSEQVGAGG